MRLMISWIKKLLGKSEVKKSKEVANKWARTQIREMAKLKGKLILM